MKNNDLFSQYQPYILEVAPFRAPIMSHAKGNYVWDVEKNKYLDMMSGQFCLAFGHSYEPFVKKMTAQMEQLTHTNTLTLSTITLEAMKELASISHPTLNKSILLSTGAEAVEFAIRYAKFITKKTGVVSFRAGYHGLTLETQSISSGGQYAAPKMPDSYAIVTPDFDRMGGGLSEKKYYDKLLEKTEQELRAHADNIAAFVVEPIISVGGMMYPAAYYFQQLKKLAEKYHALFIFDECQTGLGRSGKWFGYEHYDVVPDMLVLAKLSGNGLAVSAVVVSDTVAEQIEHKLIHFSSHQNDPLSAAALHFVISHMKETRAIEQSNILGDYFVQSLKALAKHEPWMQNPRGKGLMIGFDLPDELFDNAHNPGQDVISDMERRGFLTQAIRRGRTFRILPSFITTTEEIDLFCEALSASLTKIRTSYSSHDT